MPLNYKDCLNMKRDELRALPQFKDLPTTSPSYPKGKTKMRMSKREILNVLVTKDRPIPKPPCFEYR